MAKIKPLTINHVLTRMSIIMDGQTADVILPPLMAVVGRMVVEAAKDPRLAQYMYRHLKMAESNLEQLTVAGAVEPAATGVLGTAEEERQTRTDLKDAFKTDPAEIQRPEFPKEHLLKSRLFQTRLESESCSLD